MPEIITHGHDGFVVDNFNEFLNAINEIETISRKNCRKTIENRFTSSIMAKNYIEVYQEILDQIT